MTGSVDPLATFINAASVPLDAGHASGTLEEAERVRAAHPGLVEGSIYAAAILGDDATVRRFLAGDPALATAKGGPRGWDPLTYLCFSRYLKLDQARSECWVRAATALLDAGASANAGWYERDHQPEPQWESVLYGACGIAHHPAMTRLLLERGADPNDEEVVYHTPEGYDNSALMVLVESGKLMADSLSLMLVRKHDWHDGDGVAYLLEHGADPNHGRRRGLLPLHHAIARDNAIEILDLLLDHGADSSRVQEGMTAVVRAAHHGRGDLLASLERRGIPMALAGVDRLIAACARQDAAEARALAQREPLLAREIVAGGGTLMARFAGVGNTGGIRLLLELGVPVTAASPEGDGYWNVAKDSQALHVAAWRARHATVRLLLEGGAPVDALDGQGRTPLMLAVMTCVDSYWSDRRTTESVAALLTAGASVRGVRYPSGYAEADALLAQAGAR